MKSKILGLLAVGMLAGPMAAHAVAILVVDNGELLGADGLDVNGVTYNVRFVMGSCAANYSGCDEASDLPFNTQAQATAAANALLSEVFVNGPAGMFDDSPQLTANCSVSFQCNAFIPYGVGTPNIVYLLSATNEPTGADYVFVSGANTATTNYFGGSTNVLALFTRAVPEPATLALFGLGLLGLGVTRRRKLNRATTRNG